MIARSFKSVIWVATVGGAALCCYMVSLRVATERADLAKVERQIIAAKQEIRTLQTELGTRGRMTQLESWNADVLALSAPSAAQFVHDDVTLARLERREPTVEDRVNEVHLASAETAPPPAAVEPSKPAPLPAPKMVQALAPAPARPAVPLVHQASYTPPAPAAEAKPAPAKPKVEPATAKAAPAKAGPAKTASSTSAPAATTAKPAPGAGSPAKAAKSKPVVEPTRVAAKPAKPAHPKADTAAEADSHAARGDRSGR